MVERALMTDWCAPFSTLMMPLPPTITTLLLSLNSPILVSFHSSASLLPSRRLSSSLYQSHKIAQCSICPLFIGYGLLRLPTNDVEDDERNSLDFYLYRNRKGPIIHPTRIILSLLFAGRNRRYAMHVIWFLIQILNLNITLTGPSPHLTRTFRIVAMNNSICKLLISILSLNSIMSCGG